MSLSPEIPGNLHQDVLRSKLPARITITVAERRRLLKCGVPLGRSIRQLITIVHLDTFLRWIREDRKAAFVPRGRKRTPQQIRRLIVRLARENDWGYGRIVGELKKLGIHSVSVSTVRNILRERGWEPSPHRRTGAWDEFIKRHAATLWQCDFFKQKTLTLKGFRDLYVLVFLHVETRRAHLSPPTFYPDEQWVQQQVHAFADQARGEGLKIKLLVHDRDAKFGRTFRQTLRSRRIMPVRTAYRAPNMNAFVERFIRAVREECLHHFVVLGQRHLDHLLSEYRSYYHSCRPHQARGNLPLNATAPQRKQRQARSLDPPVLTFGAIRCQQKLGGLIKHYYRNAA